MKLNQGFRSTPCRINISAVKVGSQFEKPRERGGKWHGLNIHSFFNFQNDKNCTEATLWKCLLDFYGAVVSKSSALQCVYSWFEVIDAICLICMSIVLLQSALYGRILMYAINKRCGRHSIAKTVLIPAHGSLYLRIESCIPIKCNQIPNAINYCHGKHCCINVLATLSGN